jgi:hypothetical protein
MLGIRMILDRLQACEQIARRRCLVAFDPVTVARVLVERSCYASDGLLVLLSVYRTAIGFVAILLVFTFRPRGIPGARQY